MNTPDEHCVAKFHLIQTNDVAILHAAFNVMRTMLSHSTWQWQEYMIPSRNFYIDSDSRDNFALIMLLNEPLLFSLRASLIRVKSHQPKIIT